MWELELTIYSHLIGPSKITDFTHLQHFVLFITKLILANNLCGSFSLKAISKILIRIVDYIIAYLLHFYK